MRIQLSTLSILALTLLPTLAAPVSDTAVAIAASTLTWTQDLSTLSSLVVYHGASLTPFESVTASGKTVVASAAAAVGSAKGSGSESVQAGIATVTASALAGATFAGSSGSSASSSIPSVSSSATRNPQDTAVTRMAAVVTVLTTFIAVSTL